MINGSQIPTGATPSNVALTPGLFDVNAPNVVLEGLTISGFNGFGVVLDSKGGNDLVASDNIGTNVNGTAVVVPNTVGGVLVLSAGNTIGGFTAQDANVISGNAYGVYLAGAGATGNTVIGNLIGTDRSGTNILGTNADKVDGIEIDGASGNTIGMPTTSPGAAPGNLIEGYQAGIYLFGGASNNVIQGNAIRSNGISTPNNGGQELGGILLAAATGNHIANNDISSNTGSGIVIFNNAMGNVVTSNTITKNTSTGVFIVGGSGNMIGTNGSGNAIANNGASGVDLEGAATTNNTVLANMIQGNGQNGVYAFNAPGNTIGGPNSGDGNVIQNNGFSGVQLEGSGAAGNVVAGNTITDQASGYGVLLANGATANTIGGTGGAANTLQNNALGNIQVLINGLPPSGNLSGGNTIGEQQPPNRYSADHRQAQEASPRQGGRPHQPLSSARAAGPPEEAGQRLIPRHRQRPAALAAAEVEVQESQRFNRVRSRPRHGRHGSEQQHGALAELHIGAEGEVDDGGRADRVVDVVDAVVVQGNVCVHLERRSEGGDEAIHVRVAIEVIAHPDIVEQHGHVVGVGGHIDRLEALKVKVPLRVEVTEEGLQPDIAEALAEARAANPPGPVGMLTAMPAEIKPPLRPPTCAG